MTDTKLQPLSIRVDTASCPSAHSLRNKLGRVAWGVVSLMLFRPSPRICHGWRRGLLRCFGAHVGRNVKVDSSVRIWAPWNLVLDDECSLGHHVDCYNVDRVHVGAHATVSQYAFLCTASHDVRDPNMRLVSAAIHIEEGAWICASAFVAPGIRVGKGGVAAACAVVTKDVAEWTIVGGNPASFIKQRVLHDPLNGQQEYS